MIREDQVFIANAVVIDSTWEMMVTSVISRLIGAIVKPSAIVKIRKYRGLCEGPHFISMTMEVHNAFRHDMDRFIKGCAHFFHNRWLRGHLFVSFCIHFLGNVLVLFFNIL
jgi:hypothetical protein